MDILAQASSVVEQAEAMHGRVTLTLDVDEPAQRAAYAAALAVLQVHGIDPSTTAADAVDEAPLAPAATQSTAPERQQPNEAAPADDHSLTGDTVASDAVDAAIRRSYSEALGELTPDEARAKQVVQETFPRVRELLRDGANVEAVAQIQYRRWTEEHLDTARN